MPQVPCRRHSKGERCVINVKETKENAKRIGLKSISRYKGKEVLIHAVQELEGNVACFRRISDCTLEQCAWYNDCEA